MIGLLEGTTSFEFRTESFGSSLFLEIGFGTVIRFLNILFLCTSLLALNLLNWRLLSYKTECGNEDGYLAVFDWFASPKCNILRKWININIFDFEHLFVRYEEKIMKKK